MGTPVFQYKCESCGEVVKSEENKYESNYECPLCGASRLDGLSGYLTPEHDKQIMEQPDFSCPDCGLIRHAVSSEDGEDWHCENCGYRAWRSKGHTDIPKPSDGSQEEAEKFNAWSRYHRYINDEFEYDK